MSDGKLARVERDAMGHFALMVDKTVLGTDYQQTITALELRRDAINAWASSLVEEAVRKEMEACIQAVDNESVDADATGDEGDKIYNRAIQDAIYAIRTRTGGK